MFNWLGKFVTKYKIVRKKFCENLYRACYSCGDFIYRGILLTNKLVNKDASSKNCKFTFANFTIDIKNFYDITTPLHHVLFDLDLCWRVLHIPNLVILYITCRNLFYHGTKSHTRAFRVFVFSLMAFTSSFVCLLDLMLSDYRLTDGYFFPYTLYL